MSSIVKWSRRDEDNKTDGNRLKVKVTRLCDVEVTVRHGAGNKVQCSFQNRGERPYSFKNLLLLNAFD